MLVTRERILKELRDKSAEQSIAAEQAQAVFETLVGIIAQHVNKGDIVDITAFKVYPKGERKKGRSHSSRSHSKRLRKTSKWLEKFSGNIVLGECIAMATDWRYLSRKTRDFSRKVIILTAIILVYYHITLLIGC